MAQKQTKTMDRAAQSGANEMDALLVAAGKKDREAFVALFHHFAPRVKSYLMKGGLSEAEAEDVAQDAMLSVWHKAGAFDPARARASTWIFTIARNRKIDHFRRNKGGQMLDSATLALADERQSPREDMIALQETEAVAKAFESLPPAQRELVEKSFFEGKSHGDIAAETGIPLGTVKSRIRLALEHLRGETGIRDLR